MKDKEPGKLGTWVTRLCSGILILPVRFNSKGPYVYVWRSDVLLGGRHGAKTALVRKEKGMKGSLEVTIKFSSSHQIYENLNVQKHRELSHRRTP